MYHCISTYAIHACISSIQPQLFLPKAKQHFQVCVHLGQHLFSMSTPRIWITTMDIPVRARGRDDSEFTGWYLAWWTLLRDLRDDIFKKTLNCAHHKRVKHELMKMQELYFMNLNLVFGIILTFRFKSSYSINSQLQRHPMPCHMAGNGNGSISWNFGSSIIAPHTKTPKRHPREGRCTYNVQAA